MHLAAALNIIEDKAAEKNTKALALLLNDMILHRFDLLVMLLYRVDVPEEKAKQLLKAQPQADAGMLLAELILQRQQQKEAIPKSATANTDAIPEEDRW